MVSKHNKIKFPTHCEKLQPRWVGDALVDDTSAFLNISISPSTELCLELFGDWVGISLLRFSFETWMESSFELLRHSPSESESESSASKRALCKI